MVLYFNHNTVKVDFAGTLFCESEIVAMFAGTCKNGRLTVTVTVKNYNFTAI